MIYGSKLPRLRYPFWRLVGMWNERFNRIYVVYVGGSIDSVFRNRKQAFEYANIEGGEVNDDTPLYNRLCGRDAIVGAEMHREDREHNKNHKMVARLSEALDALTYRREELRPRWEAASVREQPDSFDDQQLFSDTFEVWREARKLRDFARDRGFEEIVESAKTLEAELTDLLVGTP